MKKNILLLLLLTFSMNILAQEKANNNLMFSATYNDVAIDNIRDILEFEDIQYLTFKFTGNELKGKMYQLTVKEIWNGEIRSDATIVDSQEMPYESLKKINDTTFTIRVVFKRLSQEKKLRMMLRTPAFSTIKEFDAFDTKDEYSLRDVVEENGSNIKYGESFYLMTCLLPYDRGDGFKSWCDVIGSGEDIESWGQKFEIPHYLVFEMKFE